MFNNPFDSFHKTVGKAKKEREQLDRLLTISTPGELTLVAVTAGVLLLFVAWLLFGSVARSVTIEGILVAPDGNTLQDPPLKAAVWFEPDLADEIRADMPALVEVALRNGEAHRLGGRIAAIAKPPLSGELAPLESAAPISLHMVSITLDGGAVFAWPDGQECRIVIELGRQSPLDFFMRRRS